MTRRIVKPARRTAALLIVGALLTTGCGSRASDSEIQAGAGVGAGPVQLDDAALEQLRQAAAAAPAAAAPGMVGTPSATGTDAVPGTVAQPGGATPAAGGTATRPNGGAPATATAGASSGACTTPGAPLNLGQIGSFSGVFGPITASGRTAMAVWAKHVNASGGLACHPVNIYAVDDGGDPSRGAALIGELVTQHKVQALVGVISLALPGMMGAIERSKLPVVGGDMVAPSWFAHPQMFPQGGGLNAIIDGALKQAIANGKLKHGLLYCVESSICTQVARDLPPRAKAQGAEVVYSSPISLTQTDFTAQCQNAKNAGVDAFGMAVDGSGIARVARSCAALGYFPQFVTGGGIISAAQARDPGMRKNTVSTASSNAPWMLTDTPGQKEYAQALARYAPGMETDGPSMVAWAAAKLFEAAIKRLGDGARAGPITSSSIFTGLGKIKNDTLGGLSPPITFTPGQKAAPELSCVYFELLTDKGWTAPKGSTPVCTPPPGGGR